MYGAIIGDFIGSLYEYKEFLDSRKQTINIQRRKDSSLEKDLFKDNCFYSDDTILIMAILDSIINKKDYEETLKKYAKNNSLFSKTEEKTFPNPFSKRFLDWCDNTELNNSIGNGASMRISPIAYLFDDLETIEREVIKCTCTSHNSKEAIDGALAVASSIFMARKKKSKEDIKFYIEENFNYHLNFDLEDLHKNYLFSSLTSNTIPQCIYLFLVSSDYEDLMRKCLYVGGDTDTIACIAGSIGEAYYGVNSEWITKAKNKLPKEFISLLDTAYSLINDSKKTR